MASDEGMGVEVRMIDLTDEQKKSLTIRGELPPFEQRKIQYRIKEICSRTEYGHVYWFEVQKLKEFFFFSWWGKISVGRTFMNFEAAEKFLKDFVGGKIKPKSNCVWYDERGEKMS